MVYHSHKLNSSHFHIIGRTDPITGDTVKENDKVVFCASCKSCFLEESWMYMEENHCQQTRTLDFVPALPSKFISKKREEKLISELKNYNSSGFINLFFFVFTVFAVGLSLNKVIYLPLEVAMILGVFIGLIAISISSLLTSSRKFKRLIGQDKSYVRLFYTHVEIGKNSFL